MSLPETIYSLWLDGRDKAPDLVKLNFDRWSRLNPEFDLRVLDRSDIEGILRGTSISHGQMAPAALSDVVRCKLLLDSGGTWVDASVYPVRPLSGWLPSVVEPTGFFAFAKPDRDRLIASWFLAVTPGHPLMERWWSEIQRFWSHPRELASYEGGLIPPDPVESVSPEGGAASDRYPYFWFHYLFAYLVANDPELTAIWEGCPKFSAVPPHAVQRLYAANPKPRHREFISAVLQAPVQKLDWRKQYPLQILTSLNESSAGKLPLEPLGFLKRLFGRR